VTACAARRPVLDLFMSPEDKRAVNAVVARNIASIVEARRRQHRSRRPAQRFADRITAFTGSIASVVVHLVLFGGWVVLNSGAVPGVTPWDPFPFVMLAMWASVEAIFLTTFVLISQNRMAVLDDQRADLDLQIDLLAEHEVTRLLQLVDDIARHLGVPRPPDDEVEELKQVVVPQLVLDELDAAADPDDR
jgi:uncharacterized membrane protein